MWKYQVILNNKGTSLENYEIKKVFYSVNGDIVGCCNTEIFGSTFEKLMEAIDKLKSDAHNSVIEKETFELNLKESLIKRYEDFPNIINKLKDINYG